MLRLLIALVLAGGSAHADAQSDADQLTRDAIALGKSGNLDGAIAKFKAAQKLFPRPNNHCNVGLAYAQLGRWPKAYLYLDRCKSQVKVGLPDWVDKRLKQATDALRAALYVQIEVTSDPTGALLSEEDDLVTPATLWLPLGEREITLQLAGHLPERRVLKLDDVRPQTVHVVMGRVPEPSPEPMAVRQNDAPLPPPPPLVVEVKKQPPLKLAGGVTLGVGLASLGISLALYLVAREVATPDANALTRDTPAFNDALSRFRGEYYSSIALLAVGGALTIGGVAVLAASAKKKR